MPDSTLAIEYNAIIPYLIEAIKELNRRLEKINSDSKENSIFKSSKEDQNVFHTSKLFQNQPNPFNKETVIKYEIDDDNAVAKMLIFNIQGTLLKSYSLNKSGEIRIKQSEFQPGMYLYSLIQDGLEIDTKRFILTQDN
jgi:hypothetical protein